MCGIAGFTGSLAVAPGEVVRRLLVDATNSIAHRGPDGAGSWIAPDDPVALGHRRLAIIDLSDEAAQPMLLGGSSDHVITYNGELYNYQTIRGELDATGYRCTTESDTEVLLAGCATWGPVATLRRSHGMFAFAYFDRSERVLWLGRDRFGEKPLYVGVWNGTLAFGSELKVLRALPGFPADLDVVSVDQFVRHQAVSPPRTIYSHARQVRAGTLLRVRISDHITEADISEHVYWDSLEEAEIARQHPFTGSLHDATQALDDVLGRSVAESMVSDVPLGAFLSGGIDSSTIVSLMCRHSTGPVKTFTIGFAEDHMSEAAEARKIAAHLGVDHTELTVTAQDALDVIPSLADMYDEPFGDSSQIPTHLVAAMARQHVTVALSGDAGDEVFGGYYRYFLAGEMWGKIGRVPPVVRSATGRAIASLSPDTWDRIARTVGVRRLRNIEGGVGDRAHKLAGVLGARGQHELYRQLVTSWDGGVVLGAARPESPELPSGWSFTEQMMLRDTVTYLPDDILVKVDRAAMATALETRVPMLDPEVFRFAWSLPLDYKARSGTGKLVLRELLAQYVPRHLWERPKMGFGIPVDMWLRGPLREWGDELLAPSRLRDQGLLDEALVSRHWAEHQAGTRNWQYKLWGILMLQAWLQRWA